MTTVPDSLTSVARALDAGGAVLLPTETVWGLAARADNAAGIDAIYALKGRPDAKPLAVCVATVEQAEALAVFSTRARQFADAHWPGPLTLVLPAKNNHVRDPRTGDMDADTVALRCPKVFWRKALCTAPLALTSANLSGEPAAASEAEARLRFPDTPLLPDPHPDEPAAPTTILRVNSDRVEVLRQGGLVIAETVT